MTILPYIESDELMVGSGHSSLSDTLNRALRQALEDSGYDPDDSFPGLHGPVFNVASYSYDSAGIQAAYNDAVAYGAGYVWCPAADYDLDALLTFSSPYITICGEGYNRTKFIKSHNGNAIEIAAFGVKLRGLHIDGNGTTGKGVYFPATSNSAYCSIQDSYLEDFSGSPAIEFAADAGKYAFLSHLHVIPASTGDVTIKFTGTDTGAMARMMVGVNSPGGITEINGTNDLLIHNCFIRNVTMGADNLGVHMVGTKLGTSGTATTLKGTSSAFVGNTFSGDLTIDADFNGSTFVGNVQAAGFTFTNSSNAGDAQVLHHQYSGVDLQSSNDLNFQGGYRQTIDGFFVDNVAASQTGVAMGRGEGRWIAPRAGSITGVCVQMADGQARTAGTLTVEVWVGVVHATTGVRTETATGLTAVLNGTNAVYKATLQAKDTDTFVAGTEIFMKYTTDGSWTPTTGDIRASVEVET